MPTRVLDLGPCECCGGSGSGSGSGSGGGPPPPPPPPLSTCVVCGTEAVPQTMTVTFHDWTPAGGGGTPTGYYDAGWMNGLTLATAMSVPNLIWVAQRDAVIELPNGFGGTTVYPRRVRFDFACSNYTGFQLPTPGRFQGVLFAYADSSGTNVQFQFAAVDGWHESVTCDAAGFISQTFAASFTGAGGVAYAGKITITAV